MVTLGSSAAFLKPAAMAKPWFSHAVYKPYGDTVPAKKFVKKWLLFLDLVERAPEQLLDLIEKRRSQMEEEFSDALQETPKLRICRTEVVCL